VCRTITPRQAAARYRAIVRGASAGELESAARWYSDAENHARQVADMLGAPTDIGAAVIAAYSPQATWSDNLRRAYLFASGKWTGGILATPKLMADVATRGADALNGPKVHAFAKAIAGDDDAVVIDLWMARAARLERDSVTAAQYRLLSAAVRRVAEQEGLTPRTCQALIWIRQRGKAD